MVKTCTLDDTWTLHKLDIKELMATKYVDYLDYIKHSANNEHFMKDLQMEMIQVINLSFLNEIKEFGNALPTLFKFSRNFGLLFFMTPKHIGIVQCDTSATLDTNEAKPYIILINKILPCKAEGNFKSIELLHEYLLVEVS